MENRQGKVVEKTVIERGNTELNLCSCESDVVDETCSLGGDDTCGDCSTLVPTKPNARVKECCMRCVQYSKKEKIL